MPRPPRHDTLAQGQTVLDNEDMTLRRIFCYCILFGFSATTYAEDPPNVLIILADDLGYTDVGAFGAELIATPHIDRLSREGMKFTRAYAPCSVCSPTRYGLLTGRYYWRSKQHPETKVIQPGQGLSIEKGRETLATLFKKKGYHTGIIGKWHLGFGEFKTSIRITIGRRIRKLVLAPSK